MPTTCLIIPPSPFLLDERVFMSLGVLKVAAVLEQKGYKVDVLDLSGVENYLDVLEDYLEPLSEHNIRRFGITATTPQMPFADKIRRIIQAHEIGYKQISLGGPHVTLTLAAAKYEQQKGLSTGRGLRAWKKLYDSYDHLVAGDGELVAEQLLDERAPKVIDADDPHSGFFLTNKTLDESPFPARHLVDWSSYRYQIDGVPAMSLIAQLGCPFGCGFCGGRDSPSFRRTRQRSTSNIIAEMELMYRDYGVRGFMFYDDELNVNPNMIELMNAIQELQSRLGVDFRLRGFLKAQLFTDKQAKAMYDAGFRWLLVGFESGSPLILDVINKRSTREDNNRCMEIARRYGLKVKALMSIGHPGESFETVHATTDWLLEAKPDDFDVTIITPYPGSPYYDHATLQRYGDYVYERNGHRLHMEEVDYTKVADYYKGNPDGGYVSHVWTDYLSKEHLVHQRDGMERRVRKQLDISWPSASAATRYEHSMGQGGPLPEHILRSTAVTE